MRVPRLSSWQISMSVLALVLLVSTYFVLRPSAVLVEVQVVRRGEFVASLRSEAKIRAVDVHELRSPAEGDMSEVSVVVGDHVEKGQILFRIESDFPRVIKAPMAGVVTEVARRSPGPIQRGEPILVLADLSRMEIVAEVLTGDAVKIRPGAEVRVSGWGGAEPLLGRVRKVSQAGFTKPSALGVDEERTEVVIDLASEPKTLPSQLGHNFHVEVEIEQQKSLDQLLIPLGALFRQGTQWACYRVREGRAELVILALGDRNQSVAVVLSGVNEGDQVVMYPGDLLSPSAKVRIQKTIEP